MSQHETTRRTTGFKKPPGTTIERRKTERIPFSAVAQIVEPRSQTRMSARVADISVRGCYVDLLNPMPVKTRVEISIDHSDAHLMVDATVTYALPGMGMGLSFGDLPLDKQSVLNRWIAEVRGESAPVVRMEPPAAAAVPIASKDSQLEKNLVSRLIDLMVRKNLITPSEGKELLGETFREN